MLTRTNEKTGQDLSQLGFGFMRLPSKTGAADEAAVTALVREAVDAGVDYFDTAFVYGSGKNETDLGKALTDGYRARVKIATKMPPYKVSKLDAAKKIFATQLARLQTDYIDYYLLHMVMDKPMFDRLADLGVMTWLEELKAAGVVRHIGFSFHGGKVDFEELIAAYPWDVVQIQYNYLDENNQATKSGLQLAARLGIPVVVMEPLRGGQLVANLPEEVKKAFKAAHPTWTPVEWALRWLWDQPEVTVVLSGMCDSAQLEENVRIAREARAGSLTDSDRAVFEEVKRILLEKTKVPCTACGYCMPCPFGVDIPGCFSNLNDKHRNAGGSSPFKYAQSLGAMSARPGFASNCTECGKCEPHCPQKIQIISELKGVAKEMEGPLFRPLVRLARKFMKVTKPASRK
jgi:predicted aldo/keto reductase-like oxidoreductase